MLDIVLLGISLKCIRHLCVPSEIIHFINILNTSMFGSLENSLLEHVFTHCFNLRNLNKTVCVAFLP